MVYKKRPYGLKSIGRFHINNLIFKNNLLPSFHIIKKAEIIFYHLRLFLLFSILYFKIPTY